MPREGGWGGGAGLVVAVVAVVVVVVVVVVMVNSEQFIQGEVLNSSSGI